MRCCVVVVMGVNPGGLAGCAGRSQDWWIGDPCGKDLQAAACIGDAIDRRVQRLLVGLGGAPGSRRRQRVDRA